MHHAYYNFDRHLLLKSKKKNIEFELSQGLSVDIYCKRSVRYCSENATIS
uniref:Uncharacterized protein n=1 Tax=Arundo donax TaxID=35708 RepID=A0A0A8YQ81_ARUDO